MSFSTFYLLTLWRPPGLTYRFSASRQPTPRAGYVSTVLVCSTF